MATHARATRASVFERFSARPTAGAPDASGRKGGVALRAFANEDIYFLVKHIDNSRVVRQADPSARGACWKTIGAVGAAAVLLIGILLPGAYNLMAGYRLQALKQEATRLEAERAALEVQEVQLLSPARMEQLAREQQFIDPEPQKVVYLETQGDSSLALNDAAKNH